MKLYYVKKTVEIKTPFGVVRRSSPPSDAIDRQEIPISHIFCGNVSWEVILAKRIIGEESVVLVPERAIPPQLLPYKLKPYADQRSFLHQITSLATGPLPVLKIALLNGFGTMLGDTLNGLGAYDLLLQSIRPFFVDVQTTAFLAINARAGAHELVTRSTLISDVQCKAPSIEELRPFDLMIDFSELLGLNDYLAISHCDFYLMHLAMRFQSIERDRRRPYALSYATPQGDEEVRSSLSGAVGIKVLLHSSASVAVRSMSQAFFTRLMHDILAAGATVVLDEQGQVPENQRKNPRILDLSGPSFRGMEALFWIVDNCDYVVSVDTSILHVAAALKKPGYFYFSVTSSDTLLANTPESSGQLIHAAEELPLWGKVKADDQWPKYQSLYEEAWQRTSTSSALKWLGLQTFSDSKLKRETA